MESSEESSIISADIKDYEERFARYNRRRIAFLRAYMKYYHRLEVIGAENLPDGPALIAANHGGGFDLDIMTLGDCCSPTRPMHALIDAEWHFLNHWWGRYFIGAGIPIWTHGGMRWEYIDPYLKEGGERFPSWVVIFPEGHSGTFKNRRTLWPFFPGVVRIALRYRVPIVPVGMIGFHAAAPILGEIERDHRPNDVLFLPFIFPVKLRAVFGKPFELSEYYDRPLAREEEYRIANNIVRPRVAELISRYSAVDPAHGDSFTVTPQGKNE